MRTYKEDWRDIDANPAISVQALSMQCTKVFRITHARPSYASGDLRLLLWASGNCQA